MADTQQRSITFPKAMLAQLEAEAALRRVTLPTVVRWACEAWLVRPPDTQTTAARS